MSSSFSSEHILDENMELDIRNSYLSLRVKLGDVINALRVVKEQTKAKNLSSAIELMYFCAPSRENLTALGLIITIHRCIRDGNVIPMVSLAELYQKVKCD